MSKAKKILTAGLTFASALGIGFVMQNGDALAQRTGMSDPAPVVLQPVDPALLPLVQAPVMTAPQPGVDYAELRLPAEVAETMTDTAPVLVAAVEPDAMLDSRDAVVMDSVACAPTMTAVPDEAGMVAIELHAPCFLDARLTIHHQGMMFTAATDDNGALLIDVPALAVNAVFIAAFDNGIGAVASVDVPEVATLDRAVLQWQGDAAVGINAYEFGAEFGTEGHVSAEHPRDPSVVQSGQGFLVSLGDPTMVAPLRAEVYTFPQDAARQSGAVQFEVAAEITAGNCGRDVAAQSIQIKPDQDPEAVDLELRMPGCDAVGDYLLLKNMFEDLTLAAK